MASSSRDDSDTDTDIYSLSQRYDSDAEESSLLSVDRLTVGSTRSRGQALHRNEPQRRTAAAQAAKALEVAMESRTTARISSSRAASRASTSRSSVSWQRPLLDAGPAPPDYSQATAYRTFPFFNSIRSASQDGGIEPAVDNSRDDPDLRSKTTGRKTLRSFLSRNWRSLCILNLMIYCSLVTIILIAKHLASREQSAVAYKWGPAYPEHPSLYNETAHPETRQRFHPNTAQCHFASFSPTYGFGYQDMFDNFTFTESSIPPVDSEHSNFQISGNVDIRPAPHDQDSPIDIWASIATTYPWQLHEPEELWKAGDFFDYGQHSFGVRFPSLEKRGPIAQNPLSHPTPQPCIHLWVGIYVNTRFSSFDLRTNAANIDIGYPASFSTESPWILRLRENARISTQSGNISSRGLLVGRETELSTVSGNVSGNYYLWESLNVSSVEGMIDVRVEQSPDVRYEGDPEATRLVTENGVGATRVVLEQEAVDWFPRDRLFNLESKHSSRSGNIYLDYGREWEGVVEATSTGCGSIDFAGRDSRWCGDEGREGEKLLSTGLRQVCAVRGSMNSTMLVDSADGQVQIVLP